MSLIQVVPSQLDELAIGSATLLLVEAEGFSKDGRYMLVKATYLDSGDTSNKLHYATYIYDTSSDTYIGSINANVGGVSARSYDVKTATIIGSSSNYQVIAEVSLKDSTTSTLVKIENGLVVSNDIVADVAGFSIDVEHFSISEDGRFIAIQTSSSLLASDNYPDTNDSSDIYVIDTLTETYQRVSIVGGSEVYDSVYLKDISTKPGVIEIAFVTDAAFVSPSSVDVNSADLQGETGSRSDVYVWSATFDSNGVNAQGTFELVSINTEGKAAGYVDALDNVQITSAGVYFTSSAFDLIASDQNNSKDVFLWKNGAVSRVDFADQELSSGAIFLAATSSGNYVTVLTESTEITLGTFSQQFIGFDTAEASTEVLSSSASGQLGNNFTIDAAISDQGHFAFTTLASNITSAIPEASQGSLYLNAPDAIPLKGVAYHWGSRALLPDVTLNFQTVDQQSDSQTVTDALGKFSLTTSIDTGALVASKSVSDADASKLITSNDALAALKIAVGLNPNTDPDGTGPLSAPATSPYQFISADINQDGKVTSADALHILKIAVGLSVQLSNWLFMPEGQDLWDEANQKYSIDKSNVEYQNVQNIDGFVARDINFVGILLGDVNNSWLAPDNYSVLQTNHFEPLVLQNLASYEQWFIV